MSKHDNKKKGVSDSDREKLLSKTGIDTTKPATKEIPHVVPGFQRGFVPKKYRN